MKRFAIVFAGAAAAGALAASAGEISAFGDVDTDASGTISKEEFVSWKTADGDVTEAAATENFVMIDADYDGEVSEAEYEEAKEAWGEKEDAADDMTDDSAMGVDTDY
ncbi:hypothetical protein D1224_02395 [Henriciella barbarensis]|uniref:EF-hand domain-containing protein n=1 Tax=Henriciella barbarensis TaxID=86342 RepID=A0A399R3B0_9PROT|nr:hypothetical protein [Henriciella barbarensis]RIJ25986.1 hypothetical protein D1224_02395 [Henriciella barbarensis]